MQMKEIAQAIKKKRELAANEAEKSIDDAAKKSKIAIEEIEIKGADAVVSMVHEAAESMINTSDYIAEEARKMDRNAEKAAGDFAAAHKKSD